MIANTLVWVSVENILGCTCSQCFGGSTACDKMLSVYILSQISERKFCLYILHETAGITEICRHQSTRTVVLEAAREDVLSASGQRRNNRVSLVGGIVIPVPAEGDLAASIDELACLRCKCSELAQNAEDMILVIFFIRQFWHRNI